MCFQVIEGGEADINFVVHDPDGVPVITEVRRSESSHKWVDKCFQKDLLK